MADVENQQEPPLPVKRKPDLYCQDQDNVANKAQKLEPSNSTAPASTDGENCGNLDSSKEKSQIETGPVISSEKATDSAVVRDEIGGGGGDLGGEAEKQEADGEEGEEEEARREAEIDRKGKGIMRDDKGKGKLIEESDSDEENVDEDAGSDLSDDPLTEVDLDNILPSRTRRRAMQPGLYISDEIANHDDDDDDDDDVDDDDEDDTDEDDEDDSDDSDA